MLSLHSRALVTSMAWPLLDYHALASSWGEGWEERHNAFLQAQFANLGRDEITQVRDLVWHAIGPQGPTPRHALGKLARLFTEVRGGRTLLKRPTLNQPTSCLEYPDAPGNRQAWIPPEGIGRAWLYASRLVQPELLAVWWSSQGRTDPARSAFGVEMDFQQLESLWGPDLGDYHVHQAAAIPAIHFFPLLPLHRECWEGIAAHGNRGSLKSEEWTPIDQGMFGSADHLNFFLLVLAHGGMAGLRDHGLGNPPPDACLKCYWEQVHNLLLTASPDSGTTPDLQKRASEIYKKFDILDALADNLGRCVGCIDRVNGQVQPLDIVPPRPGRRDWVTFPRLVGLWPPELNKAAGLPAKGPRARILDRSQRALTFDRLLWLRNLIYRLFTQPPGIPGFANFKVWFGRSGYAESIQEYVYEGTRFQSGNQPSGQGLSNQLRSVTADGRVGRIEFRASFNSRDKIKWVLGQYVTFKERVIKDLSGIRLNPALTALEKVGLCFSQQLIKDEDEDLPEGVVSLAGSRKKNAGDPKQARCTKFLRASAGSVNAVVEFAKDYPDILLLIRGLDVVNHERRTPNWAPALIYHYYNERIGAAYQRGDPCCRLSPLYRHTFHAGEDFWSPADGLRAVFEPINFQVLQRDDRLGHGLILGLDLKEWARRSHSRVTRLGVQLDDLVWEWHLLRVQAITGNIAAVEQEISQTLNAMRQKLPPGYPLAHFRPGTGPEQLWQAYESRFDYCLLKGYKLVGDHSRDGWFTRDSFSSLWNRVRIRDDLNLRLLLEYLDDRELWRVWEQSCLLQVDKRRLTRWRTLQAYVKQMVVDAGIAVEACPTSNVLISGVDDYAQHPVFQLAPPQGGEKLLVALNTDDPITFSPNVCREYQLLYQAALESGLAPSRALNWSEDIRDMGLNASFLPSSWDYPNKDLVLDRLHQRVSP
ncbi:MAG: hypothetical protein HQL66_08975 [Magnetococcales bacterium]|nr:hypothetical protein [Magnetococcales bacterium]